MRGSNGSDTYDGEDVWFRHLEMRTRTADEQLPRSEFTPMPMTPEALESESARLQQLLKPKKK